MRVAIVHDWLTGMRGGERVLEQLLQLYPQAELFTLLHVPGAVSGLIEQRPITTSWISRLPAAKHYYRYALPLFPRLVEQFDLSGFDLVLSSSHCVAKGARVPPGVPHVCYCHSPMRYLYDQSAAYRSNSVAARAGLALFGESLRRWDAATAGRVTHFVANSRSVRDRIRAAYGREAAVVHPPVEVERFEPAARRSDFYVTIAALVPYKRVDLLIDAFNQSGRPLVVIGSGPAAGQLRRRARANIRFTGWISDAEIAAALGCCRGFVFAGIEDFGIAMVEAQAAGAPVIAYRAGGALDSVTPETGVLFDRQTAEGLNDALIVAEQRGFDARRIRRHAQRFAPARFRSAFQAQIAAALAAPAEAAV